MMVREVNWAGPCIDIGPLVRETPKFYVYWRYEKENRIAKRPLVHIEPCRRCMDHPQTHYPRGYEG